MTSESVVGADVDARPMTQPPAPPVHIAIPVVDRVNTYAEQWPAPTPLEAPVGSALAADDLATPGFEMSSYVSDLLTASSRHLETWIKGLVPIRLNGRGGVSTDPGIWAVTFRQVITLSARASWVLCPDTTRVRVKRRLELAMQDARDRSQALRVAGLAIDGPEAEQRQIRTLARSLNMRVDGRTPESLLLQHAEGHSAVSSLRAVNELLACVAVGSRESLLRLGELQLEPRLQSQLGSSDARGVWVALLAAESTLHYAWELLEQSSIPESGDGPTSLGPSAPRRPLPVLLAELQLGTSRIAS